MPSEKNQRREGYPNPLNILHTAGIIAPAKSITDIRTGVLLSLSPEVMALVEKKELSAGHARALLPLGSEKLQLDAAREVLKRSLSVRGTEQLAARLSRAEKETRKEDPLAVNYAAEVGNELSRQLGRKVRLLEGKRGGKIELDYYDPEDREVLIDALRRLGKRRKEE